MTVKFTVDVKLFLSTGANSKLIHTIVMDIDHLDSWNIKRQHSYQNVDIKNFNFSF